MLHSYTTVEIHLVLVSYVPAQIPARAAIVPVAVSAAANPFTVSLPCCKLTVLSPHHSIIQATIIQLEFPLKNGE